MVMAMGLDTPLSAQRGRPGIVDFSGEWIDSSFEEDDRGGPLTAGPSRDNGRQPDAMLGNYLGIPYNDAGRQKAAAFDPVNLLPSGLEVETAPGPVFDAWDHRRLEDEQTDPCGDRAP